jgi:hypothetical protein
MVQKVTTDTRDIPTPQKPDIGGDDLYIAEPVEVEQVRVKNSHQLAELAFMEEYVDVMVHESADPNAENPVFTACNGVNQYFDRGRVQRVKRKYVEILAAARTGMVTTPEYTMGDGTRSLSIRRTSSLAYPFSIMEDKNPRGAAWLRALLNTPM